MPTQIETKPVRPGGRWREANGMVYIHDHSEGRAFVSFPRGIPHTFSNEAPQARFLIMNTPGGFERMFEVSPNTAE